MAGRAHHESSTQEESSRPVKRQKLDVFVKMAKPEYAHTRAETWNPHEVKRMFNDFGSEVIAYVKASAYLHTLQPGFAELQERYHNMKLMPLDEAEDGVRAACGNEKIRPTARLCSRAIEVLGEVQMATKMGQNMPTYYEVVEIRAAFAMLLVSTQQDRNEGAKKFVPDIHDVLREVVEILEERHGQTKDLPQQAIPPLDTSKAPADSNPVMVTDATPTGATTKAAPGDFRSDEYLKERVKNHKLDLVNTVIMDWDDLQGIDSVKQALERQYKLMLMMDANSKVGIRTNGVLLHGEQGTGKTSVAHSFAKRHGIQLYILGSTVSGSLVGETCK